MTRQSTEFLPEFQVALCQFYDNTERKHFIGRLHSAELTEFINFLDDVRLLNDSLSIFAGTLRCG